MKNFYYKTFQRDSKVYLSRSSSFLGPIVFFLITITLYPLAFGSDEEKLAELASGIIWISILLANLLSHQFIFNEDYKDGSLDLVIASGKSLFIWASIKIFVNWYFSSLPLIFLSLLTSFMLYLPFDAALILALTLFLGTPILSMFGALAGALTLERGNIVGSSIVIPMCLPALILGILAIQSYKNEELFFYIFLLAAFLFFSIPILIASCLGAIRLHFE